MTFVKQEFTCSQRSWYLKPVWLTLFAWVYCTPQAVPIFHSADVVAINFQNSTVYYCTTTQGGTVSGRIFLLASLLLGFVVPLAVMIVSYCRVIRVISTRNTRLSTSVSPESNAVITNAKLLEQSRKRVLRALVVVVICFVICWLPFAVYHGILERYLREPPNPNDVVRLITYGVGLANSMCNPFIYSFNVGGRSGRSFKRRFMEMMGGRSIKISPQTAARSANNSTSAVRNMVELALTSAMSLKQHNTAGQPITH